MNDVHSDLDDTADNFLSLLDLPVDELVKKSDLDNHGYICDYYTGNYHSADTDDYHGDTDDDHCGYHRHTGNLQDYTDVTLRANATASGDPERLHFGALCTDVILMIFKNLNTNEIARSVLPVCRAWYHIGRDPVLWTSVSVTFHDDFDKYIAFMKVLERARHLRKLKIVSTIEISVIVRFIAKKCPLLETLRLEHCSLRPSNRPALNYLADRCPRLKHLTLVGRKTKEFIELISHTPLVSFELISIYQCTDDYMSRLNGNCRHIESLKFSSPLRHNDNFMPPFLTNVKNQLKELSFKAADCSSITFKAVAECSKLTSLEVSSAVQLCDDDLRSLERLRSLSTIHIGSAEDVTPAAWKRFIGNLCSDSIVSASFEHCPGINHLLEALLSSRTDTIFHKASALKLIDCSSVEDRLVDMILRGNPSLVTLNLEGSPRVKGEFMNIIDVTVAQALRTLNVARTEASKSAHRQHFLKTRPKLTIVDRIEEPRSGASRFAGAGLSLYAPGRVFCPPPMYLSASGYTGGMVPLRHLHYK